MSVFTRSRTTTILGGIALVGASALVLAGCAGGGTGGEEPSESAAPGEELSLKIGTALPQTGNLAFLGPPEEAGVAYAQSVIEEYAETTGLSVEVVWGDSGNLDNKAYETEIPRILAEDPAAIIGAASSGVSLQFIDQVIGEGVILFSPANTSDQFTTYEDNGLYFRTAPSDVLQGEVHGNFVAEEGHQTLGMIVLNDAYGNGLAGYITEAFEAAGGEVVAAPTYNDGDTSFDAQISEVLAADPDAITVVSFDEAKTILPALMDRGFDPNNLYLVDGNMASYKDDFPAGLLEGAKGTYPGPTPEQVQEFIDGLDAFVEESGDEPLKDYTYAPESFDALILLGLASLAAQSTDPAEIAEKLIEVSGGSGDGEKCESFEAAPTSSSGVALRTTTASPAR